MMWRGKKICFVMLFAVLPFCSARDALQAQDQWFLIKESELRSIEAYREKSEREKQTWLLQVQNLRRRAESLQGESQNLNTQLQNQRGLNRRLTQSFSEYEADQSRLLSQRDTRIILLEAESKKKGQIIRRLVVTVVLMGLGILVPLVIKIAR
jgi:hypothetical protein